MTARQFVLLIACAQSTHTSVVAQDPSCAEPRAQFATAIALISRLASELEAARQSIMAKELQLRSCELGANTTTSQRSSGAVGRPDSSDAGNWNPVRECENGMH